MAEWIESARSFEFSMPDFPPTYEEYYEWHKFIDLKSKKELRIFAVHQGLFGQDGRLTPMSPTSWKEEYLKVETQEIKNSSTNFDDFDDIPF